MAKKNEPVQVKKGISTFNLVGKAIVKDYTFTIDASSNNSDWVYNRLNLQVDCGSNGIINAELMGGYGSDKKRENKIYVHGKKKNEEGKDVDDYSNQFTIDWDDRLDEDMFEEIGDNCFLTIGLEKEKKGETFYKKFLSAYDAIEYVKEHLEDGTVINVKGSLNYSEYKGNTQIKKEITSIALSKVADDKDFKAVFQQTVLIDKDSIQKYDSEKNAFPIECYIPEYVSKIQTENSKIDVPKEKRNILFKKTFDYDCGNKESDRILTFLKKHFSAKKDNVHEVAFEGIITKSGSLQTVTLEDLPDDIQELVEIGAFTEEEAIEKCVGNGNKVENYIFKVPKIKKVGEEKTPTIDKTEDKYKFEDLRFYSALVKELVPDEDSEDEDSENDSEDSSDELDMDALLNELDED
jgi:hypothetical protein